MYVIIRLLIAVYNDLLIKYVAGQQKEKEEAEEEE
jgi:hypothetical protein